MTPGLGSCPAASRHLRLANYLQAVRPRATVYSMRISKDTSSEVLIGAMFHSGLAGRHPETPSRPARRAPDTTTRTVAYCLYTPRGYQYCLSINEAPAVRRPCQAERHDPCTTVGLASRSLLVPKSKSSEGSLQASTSLFHDPETAVITVREVCQTCTKAWDQAFRDDYEAQRDETILVFDVLGAPLGLSTSEPHA